jgi:hypothetical protein
MTIMAKNTKRSGGRTWKNERASVNSRNKSRAKSNKYRPTADRSQRPETGTSSQYWRAGYTRKDGTHVKGHFVKNPHHK